MDIFIARQPIFDRSRKVYGYELLFRNGLENYFDGLDADQAASRMIGDGSILFGLEALTEGKKAFINLTRDSLVKDYPNLLPKDLAVLEILETVEPDETVIQTCKDLKKRGYTLALDDFVYSDAMHPMLAVADIIKIDFLESSPAQCREYFDFLAPMGKTLLAEKLETQSAFEEAYDIGYHYFQGYFFSKPVILSGKGITGNKLNMMKLLKQVNATGMDRGDIAKNIKQDLNLSYKLLRYINTSAPPQNRELFSISQALEQMSESEIKKWAALVSIGTMGEDKPGVLKPIGEVRGKMCEFLANRVGMTDMASDFFLMGSLSVMDALMNRNLNEVLKDLPLAPEVVNALLRKAQNPFRWAFEIVLALEKGNWEDLAFWTQKMGLSENEISQMYRECVTWAQQGQP